MARWRRSERQRAAEQHALSVVERRLAWAVTGALLDYPTADLVACLPELDRLSAGLPPAVGDPLGRLSRRLAEGELGELQSSYVETFDHTRRCALYLTYFAYGDTRRRGVALVQFKQAYRRAGVEFDESAEELPDHLCVVLQFGAAHDHDATWELLLDHRAAVEMIRRALEAEGSDWRWALQALCATLPPLRGDDEEAVRRLIEEGPPAEEVGLQPYLIDPRIPVGAPR